MSALPREARDALANGELDGVLFYSPRTARLFLERAGEADLTEALKGMDAYCLSKAVAEALAGSGWRKVHVAARPDEAALFGLAGIGG